MDDKLKIIQALNTNPYWIEVLSDALEVERKGREKAKEDGHEYLGWTWHQVHCSTPALYKIVSAKLLDIMPWSSNKTTYYMVRNPEDVAEAIRILSEPITKPEERGIPEDLFENIIGHDNIKTLIKYAIESLKPAHLLLSGPPASAKTMFLLELNRLPGSYYCLAQTMTGPGLADILFLHQPKFLLIDEIDRLAGENIGVINSLMATGVITESKVGKTRSMELNTKVFAAGIRIIKLPADLLSRFIKLKFPPYTMQEFTEVCLTQCGKEGADTETAKYIASEIWNLNQIQSDVRQAVYLARIAGGDREKVKEAIRTVKQYSG